MLVSTLLLSTYRSAAQCAHVMWRSIVFHSLTWVTRHITYTWIIPVNASDLWLCVYITNQITYCGVIGHGRYIVVLPAFQALTFTLHIAGHWQCKDHDHLDPVGRHVGPHWRLAGPCRGTSVTTEMRSFITFPSLGKLITEPSNLQPWQQCNII